MLRIAKERESVPKGGRGEFKSREEWQLEDVLLEIEEHSLRHEDPPNGVFA